MPASASGGSVSPKSSLANNAVQGGTAIASGSVSLTPQYIVEYLGNTFECEPGSPSTSSDCKRYRITARSNAGADRAAVMVQSTYATD